MLGAGTFLAASMLMPGLPLIAKPFLDQKRKKEQKEWNKFNTWRLRQILKRLHDQKLVEISEESGVPIVRINDKGRKKLLRYNIDKLTLEKKQWDGKWRIIIYDIFSAKQQERRVFRRALKNMKFLLLQKSVYLTPYTCHDEIEYVRQVCHIDSEVIILTVKSLENEEAYRQYFGL